MNPDTKTALIKAATVLKTASEEIVALRQYKEVSERLKTAQQIAVKMSAKGIIDDSEILENAEKLASSNQDLSVVNTAVEMNSGTSGLSLLASDQGTSASDPSQGSEVAKMAAIDSFMSEQ